MGIWTFFLTAKLYFYFRGYLQFHGLWNAVFVLFLTVPEFVRWARDGVGLTKAWVRIHAIAATGFGLAVLWQDTYFPPITTLVSFLSDSVTRPSPTYIADFLAGYWNTQEILMLAGILAVCVGFARKYRDLTPVVGVFILVLWGVQLGTRAPEVGDLEREFYRSEAKSGNVVSFEKIPEGTAPFDVVLLQVCSLSWDDLAHVGAEKNPLFSQFDFLFTRFNTVTSYSTPSALRLLRANCGQSRHEALYQDAPPECYLMDALRGLGYTTSTVFNHAEKLSTKMGEEIVRYAKADSPMAVDGLRPEAINFDETPIYGNFDTLTTWWNARVASGAPRAAVYYNTVSLHTGAHVVGDKEWWKMRNREKYAKSLDRTFSDLNRFFGVLESSGRDVLVVLVPEHGAALEGSAIQAPDLRDIPLPKITTVPLGVRFFSRDRVVRPTQRIGKSVSYQSIARIIDSAIRRRNVGERELLSPETVETLPVIPYFAENESAHLLVQDGKLLYRGTDARWKVLPADLLAPEVN